VSARLWFGLLSALLVLGALLSVSARGVTQVLPAGGGSAIFHYTTTVTTPKGKHFGGGTITVKHTQGRSLTVTIDSDDGKTKTIPLVVNSDGGVSLDPSAPAPAATANPDAAARAFMADVTIAAHVGSAARKAAPATTFDVPVTLTPVGDGTPVPAQLHMNGGSSGGGARYAGSVAGTTMTKLPPSSGLDPAALAKTVGVGAVAHHVFGPAGRIASAVAMHHKKQEEKKAASGLLSDAVSLNVTVQLAAGKFRQIDGTQNDVLDIAGKKTTVVSTWTFTKTSP
jgi:hypothetical protein